MQRKTRLIRAFLTNNFFPVYVECMKYSEICKLEDHPLHVNFLTFMCSGMEYFEICSEILDLEDYSLQVNCFTFM